MVSGTSITVTSPAHAAGTIDVTVSNGAGTSATSASDQFTFVTPPNITSINPTQGPKQGGTQVAVSGTGFTGVNSVTFNGTAAASFTVNSDTSIAAITASANAGTGNVVVSKPGGGSSTLASAFTYSNNLAPTVTSVSPSAGTTAGGTSVTITGSFFTTTGVAVTFGGTTATGITARPTRTGARRITARPPRCPRWRPRCWPCGRARRATCSAPTSRSC